MPKQLLIEKYKHRLKTLNLTAFLAEQRPRTVGKAVAPKPGLNTEVISPDGSRFDLTGPHRCLGRGGRASPEGQNWLAGPQQQDTYRSADDEPRGGSKASLNRRLQRDGEGVASYIAELRHLADDYNFGSNLNERLRDQLSWTLTVLYAKRSLPSQLPVKLKISVQQTGRTLKPLTLSRFAKAEIYALPRETHKALWPGSRETFALGAAEITLGPSAASGRPFADDALARAISKGSADREIQEILHSVLRARVVPLVGACTVDVTYGRNKGRLRLYVAKGRRTSLLGSDWFETLGIRLVGVHHIDSDPVGRVLEEFSDVFSHDDFGAYSGPPVHLQLDPSVKPIQLKARRIPIALAPKIDAEIDRLIQHGILEPTENTKWATPVVPVVKQNGEEKREREAVAQ
uniref:Uncharacterized protein n=1 Tax=Trichuris muris TaxID=70415 RepID=A0A5S6QPF2_TRIMR